MKLLILFMTLSFVLSCNQSEPSPELTDLELFSQYLEDQGFLISNQTDNGFDVGFEMNREDFIKVVNHYMIKNEQEPYYINNEQARLDEWQCDVQYDSYGDCLHSFCFDDASWERALETAVHRTTCSY